MIDITNGFFVHTKSGMWLPLNSPIWEFLFELNQSLLDLRRREERDIVKICPYIPTLHLNQPIKTQILGPLNTRVVSDIFSSFRVRFDKKILWNKKLLLSELLQYTRTGLVTFRRTSQPKSIQWMLSDRTSCYQKFRINDLLIMNERVCTRNRKRTELIWS